MIKGGIPRYSAVVLALALFGLGLRWEAIDSGFFADDYAQLGMLEGHYPLRRSKLDLFTFSDGSTHEGDTLIRSGFYPWFSDPTLRLSMFRPLASAMIALDYEIFGRQPRGYHLHSMIWWAALVGAVALLYRTVMPLRHSILALCLFALDEAHGVMIAWIANRCAIVGVVLAVLGLVQYVKAREAGVLPEIWSVGICFTLAFGFGEYALCTLGYVFAYECLRGSGSARERLRSLAPVLVPALVYLGLRGALHYTPRNSGVYVDPFSEPFAFASALIVRVPVLAADMLLAIKAECWTFGADPWVYRWFDPSWIPENWFARVERWRMVHVALGAVACASFLWLCIWIWRWTSNPHLRWLSVGSALSLLPVVGSFPSSRLLLVALIGFCPLLAALLFDGMARARALLSQRSLGRAIVLGSLALSACAYHVVVATWLTRSEMIGIDVGSKQIRNAVLQFDADDVRLKRQHVILLAAPEGSTSMYVPLTRWLYNKPVPLSCFTLSLVPSPYALTRVADNAFTIDFRSPAAILRTAPEQLLRGPQRKLKIDEVINTGVFRIVVLALKDGWPSRLMVRFDVPLEHPALRFMVATREGIRNFPLPPIGAAVEVPFPEIPRG